MFTDQMNRPCQASLANWIRRRKSLRTDMLRREYQPRLEWLHRDVGNLLESGDLVSAWRRQLPEQLSILAADLVIAREIERGRRRRRRRPSLRTSFKNTPTCALAVRRNFGRTAQRNGADELIGFAGATIFHLM